MESLPPLEFPAELIAGLCALIPCQTIDVREHRRLLIIYQLCSMNMTQTAAVLGHTLRTVRRWRDRAAKLLQDFWMRSQRPSPAEIKGLWLECVQDAPRPGAPPLYTAEQQCAIIALAVRDPRELGLRIQTWTHRIRFVYTPKHCSWLNQIEIWFGILVRKLLRHATFSSLTDLRERILQFVQYFNATMAKPFKWTYRGRALQV